ncbi:MAG: ABC transporter substrate-binding protein, partial [Planctomycetes bacterium]|nr:ABC transporter substrate-binding protein [Planctomycetota bacterium]
MEAEFRYKAEELKKQGILSDWYVTNANGDVSKQIADFKDLVTKNCDAIIITAVSPTALAPVCEDATEDGIVVIAFDSCVETDEIAGKVVSDDQAFGRVGAEFVVEKLGGKGDVAILNGFAGSACSENRYLGAMEVFNKYPGINIVSETNADWDYAKGKVAVEALISSGQNIDAIWSQGGAMTQAAVDAYNEAGKKLVPMPGEGSNGFLKTWRDNLDKGFTSICPWYPTYISTVAMDQALKVLNGEEIEPMLVMPTLSITEDQIEKYYNPELPDSYWVITNLNEAQVKEIFK